MPPPDAIRVSVVVPCRNEFRHIRAFLDSVLHQDLGSIVLEVLIADGMSFDGTRMVLGEYQRRFAALKVLDNPGKIASTGLNRAIREAQGEIIIRMDVHTIYAGNYVRSCVGVLQQTGADNVGGPALTQADGYWQQAIAYAFHTPFASGGAKFRDPLYEGRADTVPYGCWRRSTLERIGLFDETQVRSQDDELNRRLASHGGTIWQSPRIISWYRPRASLPSLSRQYFQYGFWKVAVIRKHKRRPSWRNLVPVSSLAVTIGLFLCAGVAVVTGSDDWRRAFLNAWLALAGCYCTASLAAAVAVAKREGWRFFPAMPLVFATYHSSYAAGFVAGLLAPRAAGNCPNLTRRIRIPMSGKL